MLELNNIDEYQDNFKKLLEEQFLEYKESNWKPGSIDKFKKKLALLTIPDSSVRLFLTEYFINVFETGYFKTTDFPLHNDRNYAIEVFAKVFSEFYPEKGKESLARISLVFLLSGLTSYLSDFGEADRSLGDRVRKYGISDDPIMIYGETGTGKELLAKAIRYLSLRLKKPFLAVNCSGLTETLLESQLFGIVKGAASGITQDRKGIFEAVEDGTLFLDEVGDMPINTQNQLLRVLETGEFYRVGDFTSKKQFRGRIIVATNKDLKNEIQKNRFRKDLYYRLSVLTLELPPIRSYEPRLKHKFIFDVFRGLKELPSLDKKDIYEKIIHGYYHRKGKKYGVKSNPYISDKAVKIMINYEWPGNFRELRNVLKRAYIESEGGKIDIKHLPEDLRLNKGLGNSGLSRKEDDEVMHIPVSEIFSYANLKKADIVEKKISQIYREGGNLKKTLANEGYDKQSQYVNISNKAKKIIGNERYRKIISSLKNE